VTESAVNNSDPLAAQERRNVPAMDKNEEFQSLGNNLMSDSPKISTTNPIRSLGKFAMKLRRNGQV